MFKLLLFSLLILPAVADTIPVTGGGFFELSSEGWFVDLGFSGGSGSDFISISGADGVSGDGLWPQTWQESFLFPSFSSSRFVQGQVTIGPLVNHPYLSMSGGYGIGNGGGGIFAVDPATGQTLSASVSGYITYYNLQVIQDRSDFTATADFFISPTPGPLLAPEAGTVVLSAFGLLLAWLKIRLRRRNCTISDGIR